MNLSQTKKSLKTFITVSVLAVATFGVAKSGQYAYRVYVGAEGEDAPKQVKVSHITENSALIAWQTDKETYGFVEYGSTKELGLVSQDGGDKSSRHTVTLKNLLPNTKYYFKVGSGANSYSAGEGNAPYTFVTEAKGKEVEDNSDSSSETSSGKAGLSEAGFQKYLYTNNETYDLNKDGEVNSIDYSLWKSQQ